MSESIRKVPRRCNPPCASCQGCVEYTPLEPNTVDEEFAFLARRNREEVCRAFGLHPGDLTMLVGKCEPVAYNLYRSRATQVIR